MNFFLNFHDIESQKLFFFQNFVETMRFKLLALNRLAITLETCSLFKNLRLNHNFTIYSFLEIMDVYSNFLKEKLFNNNLNNKNWNQKEKNLFLWIIIHILETSSRPLNTLVKEDWVLISSLILRSEKECILKWNSFLKSDPQVLKWTDQEDKLLFQIMSSMQGKKVKWNDVAIFLYQNSKLGIFRSGRKCRERWINNLTPSLLKTKWTPQEDYLLLASILKFGKKWAMLTRIIKGRNEHSIKYHFFSLLKKNGVFLEDQESEEIYSSKTMSEIFRILEKINPTCEKVKMNDSSSFEGNNTPCSFKENRSPSEKKSLVSKERILKNWKRIEDQMIFRDEMILNPLFEVQKNHPQKRFLIQKSKEFTDVDSFETSDEEMRELLDFHNSLKRKKFI